MTDAAPAPEPIDPAIESFLEVGRQGRMEKLLEFARIPSISALPAHSADMRTAATWVVDQLRALGVHDATAEETAGHPIVYGRLHEAPDAPTFLVYCHYDVQPVDPVELWETSPFDPFVRNGRFVGRGVGDDKGQLVMHLAAIEALRAVGRAPAVNLTFVFEGKWDLRLTPYLAAAALAALLTTSVGVVSNLDILNRKPLQVLREE